MLACKDGGSLRCGVGRAPCVERLTQEGVFAAPVSRQIVLLVGLLVVCGVACGQSLITVQAHLGPWQRANYIFGQPIGNPGSFEYEEFCGNGVSPQAAVESMLAQWNPRRPYWFGPGPFSDPRTVTSCVDPGSVFTGGNQLDANLRFCYGTPQWVEGGPWCPSDVPSGEPSLRENWAPIRGISCPAGYELIATPFGSPTQFECVVREEASCPIGNPVSPVTGAKFHEEVDYAMEGIGGLHVTRYYSSASYRRPGIAETGESPLADHWRTEYDHRLFAAPSAQLMAIVQFPDGQRRHFNTAGVEIFNRDGAASQLQSAVGGGWVLTLPTGDTERFNVSGGLVSTTSRTGLTTTVAYDANGRLATVTDHFGRALVYNYNPSGRLTAIAIPGGQSIGYNHDNSGRLTTVAFPDSRIRRYHYESPQNAGRLTGITDENNVRFATYAYDSTGQVLSSEHAGGVERYEFTYSASGPTESRFFSTAVRDPLGTSRTYNHGTIAGVYKLTSVTGGPCESCGSASTVVYDAQGNVTRRSDFRGNRTRYEYDLTRNLEVSRTEGLSSTEATTPQTRTITSEWHPTLRLPTRITEPSGIAGTSRITSFTYDLQGNLRTKSVRVGTQNRVWTYFHDELGRLEIADGPRNDIVDRTTYTYFPNNDPCVGCRGQLRSITNALGQVTSIDAYNIHGQPTQVTGRDGVVVTMTYDARQRLVSRDVGGEVATFAYHPTGLLRRVTTPDSGFLEYSYDAAHRMTGITDGGGNRVVYTLDGMGNRTREEIFDPSNALSFTRRWVYDSLSRVSQEIAANNQTTTYTYDADSNLDTETDPMNRVTDSDYDRFNRLTRILDPAGGRSNFSYSAADKLTTVNFTSGETYSLTTTHLYNGFGEMTQVNSPDTGLTQYQSDAGGNVASSTDARGRSATIFRDALNRITQVQYPSQTFGLEYDAGSPSARGRLTRITDNSGSTQWTYGVQGRLANRQQSTAGLIRNVSYQYNGSGQLSQITTPSGQVIGFGYANGRINSVSVNGAPLLSQVLYEPFGPTRGWNWANGTLTVRDYDADWQLTTIDSAGLSTYSYSADGLVQSRSDEGFVPFGIPNGATTLTVGTNNNRLVNSTGAQARTYAYDAAGNTLTDSIATFTYDDAGRMNSATVAGTTTTYLHNAMGQRVRKSSPASTRVFVYDDAAHLIGEYDASGSLVQETVWLDDIPVATLRPRTGGGVETFYIHTDHLNTPRRITRPSNNQVLWRWQSDPYGHSLPDEDADGDGVGFAYNLRFPGQYFDAETGLHYNHFRDFDPSTGRYLESDPIGLAGGINTYGYSGGNPITNFDPWGMDWIEYTGQRLTLYDGNLDDRTKPLRRCRATSGYLDLFVNYQQAKYQNVEDVGPVPESLYRINLRLDPTRYASVHVSGENLNADFGIQRIRPVYAMPDGTTRDPSAWGSWRARLEHVSGNTFGRSNFYLHNSHKGFTHGCVETCNQLLQDILREREAGEDWIYFTIRYTAQHTYGGTRSP